MPNFNKVYIDPNIYYVDDFLSEEEISTILGSTIEWLRIDNTGNSADKFNSYDLGDLIEDGVARRFTGIIKSEEEFWWNVIVKRFRDLLDNENEKYNGVPYITKYLPEGEWALYYHYENHPDCGLIGQHTTKGFSLGLNSGWTGGEIHFKHKDITFTVKPGQIVVFPASEEYTHAVLKSRGSERIVHSGFVYSNDLYTSEYAPATWPGDYLNLGDKK